MLTHIFFTWIHKKVVDSFLKNNQRLISYVIWFILYTVFRVNANILEKKI